ncbi:hypothetical protein DUK53_06145 [Listeria sp. SHR_NRA_18]|nr:hypothetical protein EP56_12080 [Listeriaceae bacterium FSL A5-0209]RQW67336.1 hypothetical protein DUK53_06145 [Listeria sp. SHR_NRA_18]
MANTYTIEESQYLRQIDKRLFALVGVVIIIIGIQYVYQDCITGTILKSCLVIIILCNISKFAEIAEDFGFKRIWRHYHITSTTLNT